MIGLLGFAVGALFVLVAMSAASSPASTRPTAPTNVHVHIDNRQPDVRVTVADQLESTDHIVEVPYAVQRVAMPVALLPGASLPATATNPRSRRPRTYA